MNVLDHVWLLLYRILVLPLGFFGALIIGIFLSPKLREGIRLRLSGHRRGSLAESGRRIWIHCSSGEFEYAKPLISEIKRKDPKAQIYVTYFSPTYRKQIERFPGVDLSEPLVFDFPGAVAARLREIKPELLLIARTDLWPELLYQCYRRKIPTIAFSVTRKLPGPIQILLAQLSLRPWSWLHQIFTVSEQDRENAQLLGIRSNIQVLGDTRYDQVLERLNGPADSLREELRPTDSIPVLVAGSTWREDEERLIPALAQLIKEGRIRLIMAPHEPNETHLAATKKLCNSQKLSLAHYSHTPDWPQDSILLIDRTGILAPLYKWGSLAFVGGSFKGSVHSVMEPLAAGAITLVGPHYLNNREAQEFAKLEIAHSIRAVNPVKTGEELQQMVLKILKELPQVKANQLKTEIERRAGASRNLTQWLSAQLH